MLGKKFNVNSEFWGKKVLMWFTTSELWGEKSCNFFLFIFYLFLLWNKKLQLVFFIVFIASIALKESVLYKAL